MKMLTYIFGLLALVMSLVVPFASATPTASGAVALPSATVAVQGKKAIQPEEKLDSLTAFFRTTKPGGKNQLLGLLLSFFAIAGALALCWAVSIGIGKAAEAAHRRQLTVFWLTPLLGCALYFTFHFEHWVPPAVDLSIWGASVPAVLSGFMLLWFIETGPEWLRRAWQFCCLHVPSLMVAMFLYALYACAVALAVPALIPGVIAVVLASFFLSVVAFYATRRHVERTIGLRRICVVGGHALGAILCLGGQAANGYSAPGLSIVLQVYFAVVISAGWTVLWADLGDYDAGKCSWPIFLKAPKSAGWALLASAGLLAGAFGLGYAAGVLLVCGVLLGIHWLNHRPKA